jgi:predicted nucleic acid-binding protein
MTLYCIDTSAWHHSSEPVVARRWLQLLESDEIGICPQVQLEILWSARSSKDYAALAEELAALVPIPIDASTHARASEIQRRLAQVGGLHHRSVKTADLLVAAAAESCSAIVLHYDADYDRIHNITGQPVEWIVERGSV